MIFIDKKKRSFVQIQVYMNKEWTKKLFDFTCNNINFESVKYAILNFKPLVDYDLCYFKIVNKKYIDHLNYLIYKKKCI